VLVEREPALIALCEESLRLADNAGVAGRITLVEGDITAPIADWRPAVAAESADAVLANPPFFDPARARGSPDPVRDRARRCGPEGLSAWVRSAYRLLRPDGALAVIAPADRLAELLTAMAAGFGGLVIYPLRAKPEAPATRVIVGARKGSRAPLRLAAGLVTHEGPRYAAAAEAVLRDAARLPGFDL
jgi:tRNA1(Val) A37 N6-methylase TrmN6